MWRRSSWILALGRKAPHSSLGAVTTTREDNDAPQAAADELRAHAQCGVPARTGAAHGAQVESEMLGRIAQHTRLEDHVLLTRSVRPLGSETWANQGVCEAFEGETRNGF